MSRLYTADQLYIALRTLIPNLPKTCCEMTLRLSARAQFSAEPLPQVTLVAYLHATPDGPPIFPLKEVSREFFIVPAWSERETLLFLTHQDEGERYASTMVCLDSGQRIEETLKIVRRYGGTSSHVMGLEDGSTNILSFQGKGWIQWDQRFLHFAPSEG